MREFTEALADEGDKPFGLTDAIDAVNRTGLMFEPGTAQAYSSTGYFLLAGILETISGQPYELLLQRHITGPAGLSDTGVYDSARVIPRMASGYTSKLVLFPSPGGEPRHLGSDKKGSGMIYATPHDVVRFYRSLEAGEILKPETYDFMTGSEGTGVIGWEEELTLQDQAVYISTGASREGYFSAGIWIPGRQTYAVVAANNLNLGRNPAFIMQLIQLLLTGEVKIEVPETPLKDFLELLFNNGPAAAYDFYQSLEIPKNMKSRAGAMQATGKPDSQAGESAAAWAPATPNGGAEWLRLEFKPVEQVNGVRLLETQTPGSLVNIGFVDQFDL